MFAAAGVAEDRPGRAGASATRQDARLVRSQPRPLTVASLSVERTDCSANDVNHQSEVNRSLFAARPFPLVVSSLDLVALVHLQY